MTSVGPARRAGGLARGGSGSFITSAGPNRFKSAPHSEFDSFAGRLAGWLALARFCLLRSAVAAVEMLSPLTNQTDRPLHARAPNELTTQRCKRARPNSTHRWFCVGAREESRRRDSSGESEWKLLLWRREQEVHSSELPGCGLDSSHSHSAAVDLKNGPLARPVGGRRPAPLYCIARHQLSIRLLNHQI